MIDELVEEICAIRREMMEECGHDLRKLAELIKRSQDDDPDGLVGKVPPAESEPTKAGN